MNDIDAIVLVVDDDASAREGIGGQLGLSEVTIKMHRAQVMHKMKAESVVELRSIAETIGIINAGPPHTKVSWKPSLPPC